MEETYGDQVRIVWKHLPLPTLHKDAEAASLASVAAHKQGKFWEFHDKLFEDQRNLKYDAFKQYAGELGMDVARFERDFADLANKKIVDDDMAEARTLELTGTPAFFVNGRFLRGAQPYSAFVRVINEELEKLDLPIPDSARQGP